MAECTTQWNTGPDCYSLHAHLIGSNQVGHIDLIPSAILCVFFFLLTIAFVYRYVTNYQFGVVLVLAGGQLTTALAFAVRAGIANTANWRVSRVTVMVEQIFFVMGQLLLIDGHVSIGRDLVLTRAIGGAPSLWVHINRGLLFVSFVLYVTGIAYLPTPPDSIHVDLKSTQLRIVASLIPLLTHDWQHAFLLTVITADTSPLVRSIIWFYIAFGLFQFLAAVPFLALDLNKFGIRDYLMGNALQIAQEAEDMAEAGLISKSEAGDIADRALDEANQDMDPLPRSIYLIGPESTGKTTTFGALIDELHLPPSRVVVEVARRIMSEAKWNGYQTNTFERQLQIMEGTVQEEDSKHHPPQGGKQTILADRTSLCALVYLKVLSPAGSTEWQRLVSIMRTRGVFERYNPAEALVVLFEPVPGRFESDGLRRNLELDEWQGIYRAYEQVLMEVGVEVGLRVGQKETTAALTAQAIRKVL